MIMMSVYSSVPFTLRHQTAAAPEMISHLRSSAGTIIYESWRPNSQVSHTQYNEREMNKGLY